MGRIHLFDHTARPGPAHVCGRCRRADLVRIPGDSRCSGRRTLRCGKAVEGHPAHPMDVHDSAGFDRLGLHRLDAFHRPDSYQEFLSEYTSTKDAFLHEARVHLFRRDRYRHRLAAAEDREAADAYAIIASRENLIMERYFPHTMRTPFSDFAAIRSPPSKRLKTRTRFTEVR